MPTGPKPPGIHRRDSSYANMTDQNLATEATDLAQRVTTNKTPLMSDYNLTAASIQDLTDDVQSFDAQLAAPQLAIDANKIKGATAKSTLSALNIFLRDNLRAGVELLKDTHEAAYQALREASQVDDAQYGKGRDRKGEDAGILGSSK